MQIVHELEFAGYEAAIPALEFILEFNSVKKLLPEFKVSKDWEDTLCSQRENSYGSTLRVWLTSLSLAVLPNLKSLVLSIEHGAGMPLDDCPDVQLQSLQTLGLTYYRSDYHFNELASLYAAAPNLNTIYASDCGGVAMHPLAPPDACELSLPNLRKLAISCLRIDDMVNLLDRVPQVEDLEYYYLGWQRNMHGKLDFMLEPLQKSLKRLCVSHLPRNHWNGGDPHPKWMELPEENFPPMDTLASFEKLEDLTIDCRFIYCDYASTGGNLTPAVSEPDGNNRLITMLPRSIRRLRISYVYRGMKRDLFGLAECRNEKFPYLEQVVMGFVERPNPMCHEAIEQTKEVGSLFQRDGVAFSIEIDRMGPETKTIVPGGTLSSRFVPVAGTQHTPCQESCCGGPITVIRLHR
jgi:hypothetical protein